MHVTPESEDGAARLVIGLINIPKGATEIWQPLDRRTDRAVKTKARARLPRLFAQSEIPVAAKALVAGLAKECWEELTQNVILSAWDFDEAYVNDEDDDR
jgi:hypothetical protein